VHSLVGFMMVLLKDSEAILGDLSTSTYARFSAQLRTVIYDKLYGLILRVNLKTWPYTCPVLSYVP
jgi:hypothetical protein